MAGIPIDTILGALPDDLKPKGTERLPQLLLNEGVKIDTLLNPTLEKIISELPPNGCLTEQQTEVIKLQRDNIVSVLNNIGNKLNNLSSTVEGINNFFILVLGTLTLLKNTKFATSVAAKIIPVVPGIIPSSISDLDDVITKLTFDEKGKSRLEPISTTLNASALSISLVNSYVVGAVDLLNTIDIYLKECTPKSQLTPLNDTIKSITLLEKEAQSTLNQTTYKGFLIEIEEVPYTDKVNRKRAIGINKSGIKLIETELSFTTNSQTLINELKFIIDRDNLKA